MAEELKQKVINIEQLRTAQGTLERYKSGKANLDNKLISNEDWWKMNHFRDFKHMKYVRNSETGKIEMLCDHPHFVKQSAWLFNSIMNKHADMMDNYPDPSILPRARDDEEVAKTLSSVVPVILDNCNFEQTYSDNAWEKLCDGTCVYAAVWNADLLNGLGDIEIKPVDLLSMYWEPGVQDLQDSRNVFILSLMDNDILEEAYPDLKGKLTGSSILEKQYHYDDSIDTTGKSVVVDWYYKKSVGSKTVLQYVKWCGDTVLYASEDDEMHPEYAENGFYNHGRYPFVMDVLFPEKGTPAGFGYIDIMRSAQEFIDQFGADLAENARWGARPRYFSKDESAVNQAEFQNMDQQIVHVAGSIDENHLKPITVPNLPGNYLNFYQMKIDELKETSGNRDFSQGSTSAGVTSGSAIAALQEAGSKGSRDINKGSYRAFSELCELVIELIRQFYDTPRTFRITGENGQPEFVDLDNGMMQGQTTMIMGEEFRSKEPVFDIKVKAMRSNPYSRLSQNELALQFYQMGFFNPELSDQALATIDMMDFEGKEKTRETISQNGTMFQQIQQMQQTMTQMAQLIAESTGDTRILQSLTGVQTQPAQPAVSAPEQRKGSQAEQMADKIRESTAVQ